MMKANILLLAIFLVSLLSCTDDKETDLIIHNHERRVQKLKNIINEKENFINLLNSELDQISTDLNSIQPDNEDLAFSSPLEKITYYDSLLIQSNNRVNELERLLKNASTSADAKLLQTMVSDLNTRLVEKEKVITNLRVENEKLKSENTTLNKKVSNLTEVADKLKIDVKEEKKKVIEIKEEADKIILATEEENETLTKEIRNLELENNRKKAELYFNMAKETLVRAENIKAGALAKNKKAIKSDLMKTAYKNFRESCLLGHPDARTYIRKLLFNDNYSKYLELNKNSPGITECGI